MVKHKIKERAIGKRFLKFEHWFLKTDAWLSLTPRKRVIDLPILERCNVSNSARISLPKRKVARLGNIAQGTYVKPFRILTDKRHMEQRMKGSLKSMSGTPIDRGYVYAPK